MNQSPEINELAAALSKAQGDFTLALKDKPHTHYKANYADLESVINTCRAPLAKYGLSFMQFSIEREKGWDLITRVLHSSGQWIESAYPILCAKMDPQSFGSAITYSKRYSLSAILGIGTCEQDDDGEKAMNRNEPRVTTFTDSENKTLVDYFAAKPFEISKSRIETYMQKSIEKLDLEDREELKRIAKDLKAGKIKAEQIFPIPNKAEK